MKNLFSINVLLKVTLLSSLLIFMGCAINPVSGKKQVSLMSEQQEICVEGRAEKGNRKNNRRSLREKRGETGSQLMKIKKEEVRTGRVLSVLLPFLFSLLHHFTTAKEADNDSLSEITCTIY